MDKIIKEKIDKRTFCIGIIGLGYVGLPLVLESVARDFYTIGFDTDRSKVDMLMANQSYIKHIPGDTVAAINKTGKFKATSDFAEISNVDGILICVPTPLTSHREPDMSFITSTLESIYPYLRKNQLVVLESTTYPGTTEEVMLPIIEKSGLKCDKDIYLAYSPEREDPGNKDYTTYSIPKVIGGYNRESCEIAAYLYRQLVVKVVPVSSARTAEAVKLTENIFRSVNIALVNELKVIYSKMGIDVWEVIDAAKTKPFGFMPFYPGPGLGGHCIPIDPFYLTWKAREYEFPTRFIEIAGEINTSMPHYVIQELMNALNEKGKALKNSSVLIIGLAYKRDIDDMRESPSLKLMEILFEKGAKTDYYDPFIPSIPKTRKYKIFAGKKSILQISENVKEYDAVLIATDHSSIDYNKLVENSQLIVDTRNATKNVRKGRNKIVKA
ncbi:MAG: nucleotide sugar dehydrogenase [Candidatus Latescibacteria bacterium]|jgi:UDP-N-acetyl-D-glucosamine dehydrogenase|nr:nucleotide sugar dehydrogenase [Candidatus Latescibacterota bacterium]